MITGEAVNDEDFWAPSAVKRVPRWVLIPGATIFAISTVAFLSLTRVIGLGGYDLSVYLMGGEAFRQGLPVYAEVLHGTYGDGYFTYPPITLLIFGPLSGLPHSTVHFLMALLGVACLLATIWVSARMLGYEHNAGLVGAALAIAGASLWLQPVYDSIDQGQVNLLIMALVLADYALAGSRRWPTGLLIGAAAAVKITPGIFIVFLFLSRQYRAAWTAVGTWLALTLLGFLVAPTDSVTFWIDRTFADSRRTASPLSIGDGFNQSLNGVVHHFLGDGGIVSVTWAALALVTAVLGFAVALAMHKRGFALGAVLATAVTGLLISPLTWHEHWVWIVPILVCLAEVSRRIYAQAPRLAPALPCIAVIPFLMWPQKVDDSGQVGPASILSTAHSVWQAGNHNPLIAAAGAAYVVFGICLLVVAAYAVQHTRSTVRTSDREQARVLGGAGDTPTASPTLTTANVSVESARSRPAPAERVREAAANAPDV